MKQLIFVMAVFAAVPLFAKVEFAAPFNDGMVLQRERDVPVWGKGAPGEKVTVSFAGNEVVVTTDEKGNWMAKLPPMPASKESRILKANEAEVKDVLVGEVWLCAGQSNTDCPIWGNNPRYRDGWGIQTISMTERPYVRLVKTTSKAWTAPFRDFRAKWIKMTSAMLGHDGMRHEAKMPSAMGYYYALELYNSLDIPIGLVDTSWGGTNIDAWTPPSGYANHPALADIAALPALNQADFTVSKTNGVYATANNNFIYNYWFQQPSLIWNGMVHAYAPMACRGMIWYQGCHNAGEPDRYCEKMHALYDGWSKEFGNPDLKLYFVQLAPWGNGNIPLIQIAQSQFAAEEKNAAIAIINDVGNLKDIHPNDKRTVARRLVLHALKRDYGFKAIRDNSPTLNAWRIEDGKFVLTFNDANGFYIYNRDRSLDVGFEVAGADGVWKKAKICNILVTKDWRGTIRRDGEIDGNRIVVCSDEVKEPVKLRYLFSAPWFGSIYSDRALPLGAFEIN